MPWAIALILFGNWLLGLASGARLGWWVHLLFVVGLVSGAMGLAGSLARARGERARSRRAAAQARAQRAGPPSAPRQ